MVSLDWIMSSNRSAETREQDVLERSLVLEEHSGSGADSNSAGSTILPKCCHRLADIGITIPTYNAEPHWAALSSSLALEGVNPSQVLIIDSSSKDRTREFARQSGYRVVCIPQAEFNHGGTRQLACRYFPNTQRLVFCTQDVVFAGTHAIELLSEALDDPSVGAAYGRQMPRPEANAIERHARIFNYPSTTQVRTLESRKELGIKTAFFSNSFAIYRRSALESVGGFPSNVILGEDSVVVARMLLAQWKIVYRADASVFHSHMYTTWQEVSRYFDTGVHHAQQDWMMKTFGKADSEGWRFLKSEMRYLLLNAPHLIPLALLRTAAKLAAYRLGSMERHLPTALKRKLSDYPQYWKNNR
jgi:rhamnosyltransferase